MSRKVVYLMSGPAHLPYLVVSLYSLRRFYGGRIEVHAWPESFDLVEAICQDPRLECFAYKREPTRRGKNSQFFDKIKLIRSFSGDREIVLYLDADTKVNQSIEELLERGQSKFCATQFCDWKSNEGVVRNRISSLKGRDPINQASVDLLLSHPFPSVNGGVFCTKTKSVVLKVWEEWTESVMDLFIADETVLHVLQAEFGTTGLMDVAVGGRWNCSPKFKPADLHDDDVRIWHFHGDSNVRLNKSQKGIDLWYPMYRRCLEYSIGSIDQWIGLIDNKYLRALEEHYAAHQGRGVGAAG